MHAGGGMGEGAGREPGYPGSMRHNCIRSTWLLKLCGVGAARVDVLQTLVAQRVVAQQVRFALWYAEEGRSLPAGKNRPTTASPP